MNSGYILFPVLTFSQRLRFVFFFFKKKKCNAQHFKNPKESLAVLNVFPSQFTASASASAASVFPSFPCLLAHPLPLGAQHFLVSCPFFLTVHPEFLSPSCRLLFQAPAFSRLCRPASKCARAPFSEPALTPG